MHLPPADAPNPWLALGIGLGVYLLFALVASAAVRGMGSNLSAMADRSRPTVLVLGAVANLCILATTLVLVHVVDGSSIGSLGLGFDRRDLAFSLVALCLISVLAWGFLRRWSGAEGIRIEIGSPTRGVGIVGVVLGWLVLGIVALQEEALFRGYMTLNLGGFGPIVILLVTTLLFVAIHVLTNRVDAFQLAGWTIGGGVLCYAYLATGSIWVPVVLHFGTDMVNVLLFDILGRSSVARLAPPLTTRHRAQYRVGYALVLVATLVAFYGPHLSLPG